MWVGLLGPLAVRGADGPLEIAAPKQRAVLAALALQAGQVVSFDALAEAVWDVEPPPSARVTVRNYVLRLRQLLGPDGGRIVTCDPGYVLEADPANVDVLTFVRLCRDGGAAIRSGSWAAARELLGQALAMWRGGPLADGPSPALHREWDSCLEQERLQALEWRIGAQLHLGGHGEICGELERLAAEYPLREQVHGLLMLALYRMGRQGDALAAYRHAQEVLADELGVEPGDELQRLHQQILTRDPTLAAPPTAPVMIEAAPRQLPASVPHFAGRLSDLELLTSLAKKASAAAGSAGTVVISAIGGTAGVGKTALAVYWAHQVADRFTDGQLHVNLRGFDPSGTPTTPNQALRGFLDALGVPPERVPPQLDAQTALYRSLLAGRRMLIVLDNARDEQQVRPLLPASHESLVIVTSRNQLAGLAATDGARLLSLDVLSHAEAAQLFTARIGVARALAEPEMVGEIASLCACLPLALAVAAARAEARPGFALAALAAELRDAATRLDALDGGDPAVSVRAVFSWSYRQLSPQAARMFRLLGLHPGPDISVPAAASLAGTSEPDTRRLLGELTRDCLITEHAPGRYAFHDLLRAYAASQAADLDSEPERREAIGRVLDHYLHTAAHGAFIMDSSLEPVSLTLPRPGAAPTRPVGTRGVLGWFDAEHLVLLAAAALAAESGFDSHAWQLAWAITPYLLGRGSYQQLADVQRRARAAATRLGDIHGQAVSSRLLASAMTSMGDYDQARSCLWRALGHYWRLGDHLGNARVLTNLGCLAGCQGRSADALHHHEEALPLYQAIGDKAGEAITLNAIGWHHDLLGHYEQARVVCRQALSLSAEIGFSKNQGDIWDSLGYAEHHLGNLGEADACYERALAIYMEFGERNGEARVLNQLGDIRHAVGDLPRARGAWRRALAILEDQEHPDADEVRAKFAEISL
jgi:DNA-binding SARP family transcriptional activator/tetratricopeptide (TPR) repeat protein